MPPSLVIRPMTTADAPAAAALSTQLGYPLAAESIAERLASVFQEPAHGCFVAEANGAVAGWVHVFGVFLLASPQFFAEIGGLVVDTAARRQGVGWALMTQAETWAVQHGFAEVRLRSGLHRTDAHEFYRSIGYELAKTNHMFRKSIS